MVLASISFLIGVCLLNLILAIIVRLNWEWRLLKSGDSQFWYLAGIQSKRTIYDRVFGNIYVCLNHPLSHIDIDDINRVHKILTTSDRKFRTARARFNPPRDCVKFDSETKESSYGPGIVQNGLSISVYNRGVWAIRPWLIQKYSKKIGKLQFEAFQNGSRDAGRDTSQKGTLSIFFDYWIDAFIQFCKVTISRRILTEDYYLLGMLAMHEGSIQGYGAKATFRIQTNKIIGSKNGPLDGRKDRTNHYGNRKCGDPQTISSATSGCGHTYCVEERNCPNCDRPNELNQDYVAMCVPYFMDVCRRAQLLFGIGMRFQRLRKHDGMNGRQAVNLSTPQIKPNQRVRRLLGVGRNQPVNQTTLEKPPEHLLSMANGEYLLESLPSNEIAEEVLRGVYDSAGLIPALSSMSNGKIHRMQLESDNGTWYWQVPICLMAQDRCNTPMHNIDWPVVGSKIPIKHDELVVVRGRDATKYRVHNQQTKTEMASLSSNIGFRNPVYSMAAKETLKTHLGTNGKPKTSKKCPERRFSPYKIGIHKEVVSDTDFERSVQDVLTTPGAEIDKLITYPLKSRSGTGYKKLTPESGAIAFDVWPEVTKHHPEEIRGKVFGEMEGVCKSMGCPHMGSCSIYPQRGTV